MAVISNQLTTSTTAAPVIAGAGLTSLNGAVNDPLPLQIKNIDASITIYIGGPGVTSSNGYPLLAGWREGAQGEVDAGHVLGGNYFAQAVQLRLQALFPRLDHGFFPLSSSAQSASILSRSETSQ